MCLYSGHDTTVTPLLIALDIFDNKWPQYAADLRFELYDNTKGEHYVKILYCGKVSGQIKCIHV